MSAEGTNPREATHETTAPEREGRSVGQLIREAVDEAVQLVRQEMSLAKAEMQEKAETYQNAATAMAVGGALLFAALLTLLWALNMGLTALLTQWMGVDIAVWLAPVILALLLGIMGYSSLKSGQSTMRNEGLTPEKTKRSLERDRSWARSRARRYREEVRHE